MASSSDGLFDPGIHFSPMRQPPLIKQLKGILSEYPDGGQILKELIQNAEDAEATEINILYDGRQLSHPSAARDNYNKFFKGPALCVANNAIFTEKDWEGIQMIYSSVKETDPLKVGRFGLGFKSVFHITDFPCVISGGNVLMIDPQQPSHRVNALIALSQIGSLEQHGLNAEAFWEAFDGVFGMNKEKVTKGYYGGTLFWFPLRQCCSDLSETIYNKEKVMDLFEELHQEASSLLLFLRNIERVQIYKRINGNISEVSKVELQDRSGVVRKSRFEFKQKVKKVKPPYQGEDICHCVQMSINISKNGNCHIFEWIVVNYFVGSSADTIFRKLIHDEHLCYSPYVGVAAPLKSSFLSFEGHVFSFLPLPREGSRLTGLPVHVNGFFALSQNRHHLKLETEEQRDKRIDDKSILWNKYLIGQAIPLAYDVLVKSLIQRSISCGNRSESIDHFYACLPVTSKTHNTWASLENALYAKLVTQPFLYYTDQNNWIELSETCFATLSDLPEEHKHVKNAIQHCLASVGKKCIIIPFEIFKTLQKYYPQLEDLSPKLLTTYLHRDSGYRNMADQDKLDVLEYILSEDNYNLVQHLELLPISSGKWTYFNKYEETVYTWSEDILKILPGLHHIVLRNTSTLRSTLAYKLEAFYQSGVSQIVEMDSSTAISFLEDLLKSEMGTSPPFILTVSSKLTIHWLHDVWKFLIIRGNISNSKHLSILPILVKGSWQSPKVIHMAKLTDLLLLKTHDGARLPEEVCKCFQLFGVTMLESLPSWIPFQSIQQYCFSPHARSIVELLSNISKRQNVHQIVAAFNDSCSLKDKSAFLSILSKCQFEMSENVKILTRKLDLFRAVSYIDGKANAACIEKTPTFINGLENFPKSVKLPIRCLQVNKTLESFVTYLGAKKVSVEDIVGEYLTIAYHGLLENNEEFKLFMNYFITYFNIFRNCSEIVNLAKNVRFLQTGPQSSLYLASQLFDPSEKILDDLLCGESLLPDSTYTRYNDVLRNLGIKGVNDITCSILYTVAISLDKLNRKWKGKHNKDVNRKANAFLQTISSKPKFLGDNCQNGFSLAECMSSLACIPVEKRLQVYPSCIKWFQTSYMLCKPCEAKDASMSVLIGGIMPIIDCPSEVIAKEFGWKDPPALSSIFEQLKIIRNCQSPRNRSEIMPVIKSIYYHLSERHEEVSRIKDEVTGKKIVWTGEEFITPDKMIITKHQTDIDLHPYYNRLPDEYLYIQNLFVSLGCPLKQDISIWQNTLECIRTDVVNTECKDAKTAKRIIVDILEGMARFVLDEIMSLNDLEILMMVHDTNNPYGFALRPITECTYDDDPTLSFSDDENYNFVHEMIRVETAIALGVKSISRKTALDAEELGGEHWGQQEPLTTRINSLLRDSYTDGLSVPKELIQNADDAGASTVKFLYDERQNQELRERVLFKGMKNFQGPALWVFNNAVFSDEDLKNITKLNAATKKADVQKIGKFGLGFCSVYNLTDLPSFITGSSIVFFDPHEKHLGNVRGTGLKYTLPNETLVLRHCDQFKPYNGVFGCHIGDKDFKIYNGTLFRLPLRTEEQAKESKICSVSYTNSEMTKLLRMLILTAGNMLLFSQNVKSIEIFHLDERSTSKSKPNLLLTAQKDVFQIEHSFLKPLSEPILSRMSQVKRGNFTEIHKIVISYVTKKKSRAFIHDLADFNKKSEAVWLLSWAKGNSRSMKMSETMSSDGAVPLAAVAIPCAHENNSTPIAMRNVAPGFYSEGHIFCFLPLPIKTKLQFHVNGCFAVTSDRRQLVSMTEDDKDSNRNDWNDAVQEDAMVIAFIKLLEKLSEKDIFVDKTYDYHSLWPSSCSKVLSHFKDAFYKHIITSDCKIFQGSGSWVSFHNSVFLDPKFRQSECGNIAFEFLTHIVANREDKIVIEMPEHIFENMKKSNSCKHEFIHSGVISQIDFFKIFFEHINSAFWDNRFEERNKIIAFALNIHDENICKIMKQIKCIPTLPKQRLRRPSDLIHPNVPLAKLFNVEDERFPFDNKLFRNVFALKKLIGIGMNCTTMPNTLLVDRCMSVSNLANACCICARERSTYLIDYLSDSNVLTSLYSDSEALESVRNSYIIPVLQRPKTWVFSWGSDMSENDLVRFFAAKHCENHLDEPLQLGKSGVLFRQKFCDYVGSVAYLIDETSLPKIGQNGVQEFLQMMNFKDFNELEPQCLKEQLFVVIHEYKDTSTQFDEFKRIHNIIFSHLNEVMENDPENIPGCLSELRDAPVIPIETVLVKAENIAVKVKEECPPFLYRLPRYARLKWKSICKCLGIKDHFDIPFIINGFHSLKENWQNDKNHVEKIRSLLVNLKDSMDISHTEYKSLYEYHDQIVAPDSLCQLWPTYDLAVENIDFRANTDIKILHRDIPISLGESLGVKTKELKCFESMSIGVSFGQREKLVNRIKGLLKAYPCDESIMKEILQNADDAGATEVHFIKDYRCHPTNRLFSKSCTSLQGPALCVFNNSYFTKEDLEGIHNLGKGSKGEDPTKTGQYGVGFNAVYHLTDTPAFITKNQAQDIDYLIIFDPLLSCVPKATNAEPGQMCKLTDVQANFPDHLLGFSQEKLMKDGTGTIFRFPLRRVPSNIDGGVIDQIKMDSILNNFKNEMKESVLFLKNVTSLRISRFEDASDELIEEYDLNVQITDKAMGLKVDFNDYVHAVVHKNTDNREENLNEDCRKVTYPLTVADSLGCISKFLIVQQFGTQCKSSRTKEMKVHFANGDLGLIPIGGVAIPLSDILNDKVENPEVEKQQNASSWGFLTKGRSVLNTKFSTYSHTNFLTSKEVKAAGKAFCVLPLPVKTGLPVHVNGHFALDHESRRDLWKDGFRMEWNMYILEYIIIPSWINGLLNIQDDIKKILINKNKWFNVNILLQKYHMLFPQHDQSTSNMWKNAISQFYSHIANQKIEIFPCVFDLQNENFHPKRSPGSSKRFHLTWIYVNAVSEVYTGGYFNDVSSSLSYHVSPLGNQKAYWIVGFLKSIGMKLIETPKSIMNEMLLAGVKDIPVSSPKATILFLCQTSCDIGHVNVDIRNSKFRTQNNLLTFVEFISQDDSLADNISDLPILLTQDNILRRFSEDHKVFISKYAKLLPGSSDLFANLILEPVLSNLCYLNSNVCRKFNFNDFVSLLRNTMQRSVYAAGLEIELKSSETNQPNSISHEWLCLLYEFFCDQSKKEFENQSEDAQDKFAFEIKEDVDIEKFRSNLRQLADWSFLPTFTQEMQRSLIPLHERVHLLHVTYAEKQETIGSGLEKLKLPSFDFSIFDESPKKSLIKSTIKQCIPSLELPGEILECLVYHKAKIRNCRELTKEESTEILAYFGRKYTKICQDSDPNNVAQRLKELPLFSTTQDTLTSIDCSYDVVVIPNGMPFSGVQEWADNCNITLLQKNDSLDKLYDFLQLRKADIDIVYNELVLPNIKAMPMQHWITHIVFLRDRLCMQMPRDHVRSQLINQLSELAFINVDGAMKRVNQFYDPENEVFRYMKSHCDFPPDDFPIEEWSYFFKELGLKCEVTDKMLINFASIIEMEGIAHENNNLYEKSDILVKMFLTNNGKVWENATLERIKSIKFIKSHSVEQYKLNIFPDYNRNGKMMCFEESVSSVHSDLCWTSSSLLPSDYFNGLDKGVRNTLQIYEEPPIGKVILHFQNICDVLKPQLKSSRIYSKELVKDQMNCFYEYFNNQIRIQPEYSSIIRTRLENKPFVHIPEDRDLVLLREVITDLSNYLDMKPYLYNAPKYYGRYHDMFEKLGSKQKITFSHYAYVLQKIKEQCKDSEMSPFERKIAQKAIRALLKHSVEEDTSKNEVKSIYLPNEDLILVKSTEIVISDHEWFRGRLHGHVNINIFAGSQFLDTHETSVDLKGKFTKWPLHLKPLFLTDCIEEVLCESDEAEQTYFNSSKTLVLERFFHSPELLSALCGILKTQFSMEEDAFNNAFVLKAKIKLQSVKCFEMPLLQTVLKYNGNVISGTERSTPYHIEVNEGSVDNEIIFLISNDSEADEGDFSHIFVGLMKLIEKCISRPIWSSTYHIIPLLQNITTPEKIPNLLQRLNIEPHYIEDLHKKDYFPKPGTYVELKFIPFLEQGIQPFEKYEFSCVAMDIDHEENFERDDEKYIYVQILNECSESNLELGSLGKIYRVRTGNPDILSEQVPIYRLYRFVRREEEPGQEIQIFDAEPISSKPFDEHCHFIRQQLLLAWKLPSSARKRVVRRFLFKWHPDMNPEQREYCTRVFQYIQILISRLENEENLAEDVDDEMRRGPSEYSPSTSSYYSNLNECARTYARAFHDNYDDYCSYYRTGHYTHSEAQQIRRPDVAEAERWLRQAKNDFRAAEEMMPVANVIKGFNWICYLCHQSCEKALKSARYFDDANNVPRGSNSHRLTLLTSEPAMYEKARLLESRLGDHTRLRYPDTVNRPRIPSDIFGQDDAEFSISVVRKMIKIVEEYIS